MLVLSIEPIEFKTKGGHIATIRGLTINDEYTFKGSISSVEAGVIEVFWNKNGSCHNQADSANLDVDAYEFKDFMKDYNFLLDTLNN
ncbi:hypothetical protein WKI25_16260 [Acinetobacter baumannii]|uniref:hypothetical protein n=1 Tax=Acinetobacter baumannii TaxID=470 RepID=UPI00044607C4|nr:hypothetical protein [Acinetobacter baumannii]EXC01290.1 hypothetical protein J539_1928 [Acinetobacter baumannii 342950]MDC5110309.1 hypothetical protein [Acinetobacter baumannii]HCA5035583.1 hypothetical protein [Acinetobacter baumannii]HCU1863155.1 hypothetical protein [Acinetobacter baumannii]